MKHYLFWHWRNAMSSVNSSFFFLSLSSVTVGQYSIFSTQTYHFYARPFTIFWRENVRFWFLFILFLSLLLSHTLIFTSFPSNSTIFSTEKNQVFSSSSIPFSYIFWLLFFCARSCLAWGKQWNDDDGGVHCRYVFVPSFPSLVVILLLVDVSNVKM